MEQVDVRITGMECTACSARIERSLKRLPGIVHATVHYSLGMARVAYEPKQVETGDIRGKIEALGFGAFLPLEEEEAARSEEVLYLRLRRAFWFSFVLALPLLWTMARHFAWLQAVPVPDVLLKPWVQWLLATPIQFVIGRRFYYGAYRALRVGGANMDVLVALATSAAYFYSHYWTIRLLAAPTLASGHLHPPLYFETSAMIITVVLLGKWIEAAAKRRTWSAVRMMQAIQPESAWLWTEGEKEPTPCASASLRSGDRIVIRSGERAPADGILLAGEAAFDESVVTGESITVAKKRGDTLLCGTVNRGEEAVMTVSRSGEQTTVARMARLVEEAQLSRPSAQRAADRVAAVFVPAIVMLAAATFALWSLLLRPGELGAGLEHAIAVLVIACPCSIGLAAPISMMVGSGLALQRGIVFKDGAVMERMGKLDVLLLDKTGTLTEGVPETVKPGAATAVREVRRLRLEPMMATGDHRERALAVARVAGISRVYAGLSPNDKAELVRQLQQKGKRVVMAGDGINDAPALATADVGIAVGTEMEVAVESADIVLLRGDLRSVYEAIAIGRRTMGNIRQNLLFSLLYNSCAIPLAMLGMLAPWVAGTAMAMSSLSVVGNALRLQRSRFS